MTDNSDFNVLGPSVDFAVDVELAPARIPIPQKSIVYIDADMLERVHARRETFDRPELPSTETIDPYHAEREASIGASSISFETTYQRSKVRYETTPWPAARANTLVISLTRQMTPEDVTDVIAKIKRQKPNHLVVPGDNVFLCGVVKDETDLGDSYVVLRPNRRSSSRIRVVTSTNHGLTWSAPLFRSPMFALGQIASIDPSSTTVTAAALFF
jgi:hypothetical protein